MKALKYLLLASIMAIGELTAFGQFEFVPQQEAQRGLAIGLQGGTYGVGVELIQAVANRVALRGGLAFYPYEYNTEINSGDAYLNNETATLGAFQFGADWQFFSFMYFSGGVFYNFTQIDFDVYPTIPDAQNNGTVSYHLQPNKLCPYLSLGLGRSISRNKIVSVSLDIGLAYQGNTSVKYRVVGKISESKLSKWTNNVTSGSKLYRIYPYINFMISFRVI